MKTNQYQRAESIGPHYSDDTRRYTFDGHYALRKFCSKHSTAVIDHIYSNEPLMTIIYHLKEDE